MNLKTVETLASVSETDGVTNPLKQQNVACCYFALRIVIYRYTLNVAYDGAILKVVELAKASSHGAMIGHGFNEGERFRQPFIENDCADFIRATAATCELLVFPYSFVANFFSDTTYK